MSVFQKEFKVETKEKAVSYVDITQSVKDTILESGIQSGTCTVVTAHTTCSIFFEEDTHDRDEDGVESNLRKYSSAPYKCAKLQVSRRSTL